MNAKATLAVLSDEISAADAAGCTEFTFYIVFGAATSAGAIQIESSPLTGYAGTWAAEGSPLTWSAASKVHKLSISGLAQILRARISTGIVGGTVDVYCMAAG